MVETYFNQKLSRLRCDNGREYLSTEMKNFCASQGIQFEFTIRYTPQQNGVAERMNRTITERARCMLLNSKVSKSFWTEAVQTAVYLINRSPTEAIKGKVPAELWYGEKPDVQKLRIFGCIAYLRLPKELIGGKFDSRSKKCRMMGYCPNGYRLWCPEEKRIILGHDIIFDETRFVLDGNEDFYRNGQIEHEDKKTISTKHQDEEAEFQEERISRDETRMNINSSEENDSFESANEEEIVQKRSSCSSERKEEQKNKKLRRSTRLKTKPKYYDEYIGIALNAETFVDDVPEDYDDIQRKEDKEYWYKAVQEEITSLLENKTWTLTKLPEGKKAINNKWVFKIKRDQDNNVQRCKARLVVKGCVQRKGFDYMETYAPVAHIITVRTLFSFINQNKLFTRQLDVKNAFLHGIIEEEIYMKKPQGLEKSDGLVCKLNKSLYGLKQAPRAWNARFDSFVKGLNLKRSENDMCLYSRITKRSKLFLLLYVDDIIIAADNKRELKELRDMLMHEFPITDMKNPHYYLGMKIDFRHNGIFLSQKAFMERMLERFNMTECKPAKTPMEAKTKEKEDHEEIKSITETKPYRELIGCLTYLMLYTRPDISAAINYFSRFQNCATESYWIGLKRILRYIKGTLEYGLFLPKKRNIIPLLAYVDADWASDSDRKSVI
ncbi:uncharacterized protein LOC113005856 isoform X1 [Solenopsis invicta]|uniref:uncharacterized protein LOC113005856 isoform X1 n=2 Tax=Solenopsis invicta TaxID=13686 RepID=UPI00193DF933|nr:uncharacterized protein LOC113005856 isoform X1 [Solenopsis invicta]XP_039309259.1 uncharacterized protein LOC113005856 isoform X1 [Solenopsis invicta]